MKLFLTLNKYKLIEDVAIINSDSQQIGVDYQLTQFPDISRWIRNPRHIVGTVNCYYIPNKDKSYADFITVKCYDNKVYNITIYTKTAKRIDSLKTYIERLYEKQFHASAEYWKNNNWHIKRYGPDHQGYEGEKTFENGDFQKRGVYVSYLRDYIVDEVVLEIWYNKNGPKLKSF